MKIPSLFSNLLIKEYYVPLRNLGLLFMRSFLRFCTTALVMFLKTLQKSCDFSHLALNQVNVNQRTVLSQESLTLITKAKKEFFKKLLPGFYPSGDTSFQVMLWESLSSYRAKLLYFFAVSYSLVGNR